MYFDQSTIQYMLRDLLNNSLMLIFIFIFLILGYIILDSTIRQIRATNKKLKTSSQSIASEVSNNQQSGHGVRILHFIVDISAIALLFQLFENIDKQIKLGFYTSTFMLILAITYLTLFDTVLKKVSVKSFTKTKVLLKKGGNPSIFRYVLRNLAKLFGMSTFSVLYYLFTGRILHDDITGTKVVVINS